MYIKLHTNGLSHIVADSKKLFTCVHGSRTYAVLSLKNELFISKTTHQAAYIKSGVHCMQR